MKIYYLDDTTRITVESYSKDLRTFLYVLITHYPYLNNPKCLDKCFVSPPSSVKEELMVESLIDENNNFTHKFNSIIRMIMVAN